MKRTRSQPAREARTLAALTTPLICSAVCMALIFWCSDRHVLFISTTPGGRPLEYQGCRRMWGTLMRLSGSAAPPAPATPHLPPHHPLRCAGPVSPEPRSLPLTATACTHGRQRMPCPVHEQCRLAAESPAGHPEWDNCRLLVARCRCGACYVHRSQACLFCFQVVASSAASDQSQQLRPCQ